MEAAAERGGVKNARDLVALRIRIATALVHIVLAAPGFVIVAFAGLALLLLATGLGSDPHGFGTAFAILAGIAVLGPSVFYLWLIRRWWVYDRWGGLAIADAAGAAIGARLAIESPSGDITWPWAIMAALALLGVILLVVPRADHRSSDHI